MPDYITRVLKKYLVALNWNYQDDGVEIGRLGSLWLCDKWFE
jgi:hypothetical protein